MPSVVLILAALTGLLTALRHTRIGDRLERWLDRHHDGEVITYPATEFERRHPPTHS